MPEPHDQDVTIMRADTSVSQSYSGSRESGEADAPRVLKQRFVLEEKLGSGGMGTVFRARDLRKVEARDRQPGRGVDREGRLADPGRLARQATGDHRASRFH